MKWVSIKDQKPSKKAKNRIVAAWLSRIYLPNERWTYRVLKYVKGYGWMDHEAGMGYECFSYWMSLPAPPEEKA